MLNLIVGLSLLIGVHLLSTARETRADLIARFGLRSYRAGHGLLSLLGLALIVQGFHDYRLAGMIPVWDPPVWTRHLTILLMWFAFVALAAAIPSASRIRGWLRHPMLVAIKIWALAHLLANGDLGSIVLFGSFLAYAVFDRIALKRRGDAGAPRLANFTRADAFIVAGGTAAYLAMIFLHPYVIGVPVIG